MKTVSNALVFVDTNILYYANDPTGKFGAQAKTSMDELVSTDNTLVISTQILREYAHVTLRNAVYHKLDLSINVAIVQRNIARFRRDFMVLHDNPEAFDGWFDLLPLLTTGKDVFDFNIAATMQANGIAHILTHNTSDFTKFNRWLTVLPLFPAA